MPLRAKRGFSEWFGLFLVFLTLLAIPSWVRDVINMVRETHWPWYSFQYASALDTAGTATC
jgi:hypothetical protein